MIPVVLIHKGNNPYIYNTLYQLRKSNPLVNVYLIGTKESAVYNALAEHVAIEDLFDEAQEFSKIYKHYSTNSAEFELICIQRWFVLKTFMKKKGIQRCLYMDTDVLVYEDVQILSEKFSHVGMTICGISGHTNFVDLATLIKFCDSIIDIYSQTDSVDFLEQYYNDYLAKNAAGGVSDMTLLTKYAHDHPSAVENIYYLDGQPTFDPAMEVDSNVYKTDGLKKEIFIKDNKPYGIIVSTNMPVLFYTLHFQGANMKKSMVQYVIDKDIQFYGTAFYYKCLYYYQKIGMKLKRHL